MTTQLEAAKRSILCTQTSLDKTPCINRTLAVHNHITCYRH